MRYKQSTTRRIVLVELNEQPDPSNNMLTTTVLPDKNHNEIIDERLNGLPKEVTVVEDGLSMHSPACLVKTGGSASEESSNDLISAKAAIGEQSEEEEDIKEYLQRSDTAVIYAEPVNVPPLNNSVLKESDELNTTTNDYFIKCPQCQKGCQTFQALKEHMESNHQDLAVTEHGPLSISSAVSPTPPTTVVGGPFGCTQCTTSFSSKDQLEKHELLHSPNANVSCKICNKTFANVYRLQRHMISHDESAVLRKFKCTECDKAFKFKHHLKEHIRIHSGEKPFECGNCGKRFSHSGSYSSHMTSKKCLVMNLKLGRTRTPNNSVLDKQTQQQSIRGNINKQQQQRANISPINNNITTSPNHNSYLPILPKYSEAAAALFQPFYLAPPSLLNAHPISPYSLSHLLEQLQQSGPVRPIMDATTQQQQQQQPQQQIKEDDTIKTELKSNTSSCDNLVMDDQEDEKDAKIETTTNNGDLEAVKRILETVNATVTKELLQANVQKLSETSSDSHSVASIHSVKEENIQNQHLDDEEEKSEGLAAKLEDALPKAIDDIIRHDDELDCESDTTTDHISEDGRKVRVRSLISDEQLKILKDNYKLNPRPKREELEKIASMIGFSVRVVQVWFQNTRARDRREGRLIQVPFNPPTTITYTNTFNKLTSFSPNQDFSEQPLDLSTKKVPISNESSPAVSPTMDHVSSGSEPTEVVNLSHKSSRSPTPYLPYPNLYQNSNSSDAMRQSPSPLELNSSRLAQILAQPAHKLSLPGMGLVPMQFGTADLNFSQLITNLSPNNSNKRAWNDTGRDVGNCDTAGGIILDDSKRKVSQYVLKSLGSPVLGVQDAEVEGQFSCDQCDKAFSKQSSLARHKYEHSGQRPHKCDECPKAFKHKHHLTEHKRLHSGEKPFQCSKCLKRFSHSGSYSQHMNHRYSYCKPYRE